MSQVHIIALAIVKESSTSLFGLAVIEFWRQWLYNLLALIGALRTPIFVFSYWKFDIQLLDKTTVFEKDFYITDCGISFRYYLHCQKTCIYRRAVRRKANLEVPDEEKPI